MAAARWLLPAPGGPMRMRLAPSSSQRSPALRAITCALETIGTAENSKDSSVLPPGRCASRSRRWKRRRDRSASARSGQQPGGWPALAVGLLGEPWPQRLDARQAQLAEHEIECGGVDGVGLAHAAPSWETRPGRRRSARGDREARRSRPATLGGCSGAAARTDRAESARSAHPDRAADERQAGAPGARRGRPRSRDRAPGPAARPSVGTPHVQRIEQRVEGAPVHGGTIDLTRCRSAMGLRRRAWMK